jgi:hypothetical protein
MGRKTETPAYDFMRAFLFVPGKTIKNAGKTSACRGKAIHAIATFYSVRQRIVIIHIL